MKVLKIIGIAIAALVTIFFIGAAFLPNITTVSRSITIQAKPGDVYNLVADFASWNSWSHWSKMDPSQKVNISGPKMKIGSEMSWQGDKTGQGKMTITELEVAKSLTIEMTTMAPMQSSAKNKMTFDSSNGGTEFSWVFTGENKYPMGRWMGLMMKGMLGKAFESSQASIKTLLENKN